MAGITPIHLTLEELEKLKKRKIGYGTEGVVFKYNRNELIKIYHQKNRALDKVIKSPTEEDVTIYQKGSMNTKVAEPITAYFYNEENQEHLRVPSKYAINLAIEKQKRVTRTRLPKNNVYIENLFAGCLVDRVQGVQIHKLTCLPFAVRRHLMIEILKTVRELIENNIYHVDLDNSPFSKGNILYHQDGSKELVGHSHILVDYLMRPHLIDLEGRSTIYTEKRNEEYEALCFCRLCSFFINFFLEIDIEELQDAEYERETLEFYLEKAGLQDKEIQKLSYYNLNIDEIETITKSYVPRRNL